MTDTTTQSLADFLLARIAEDEAVARAAIEPESTRTLWDGRQVTDVDEGVWDAGAEGYDECRVEGTFMVIYDAGGHSRAHALHIARHDPARVLAECAAHRRTVEMVPDLEGVLAALASIYADHAEFREEWRP